MSESLAQFVVRRRAELDAEETPLRERLAAIAAERDQLRRAALAAGIADVAPAGSAEETAPKTQPEASPAKRSPKRVSEKAIKEAVITILNQRDKGMTAVDMLAEINSQLNVNYPRTSLSPLLTRLKKDNAIKRKGIVWRLVKPTPIKSETEGSNLSGSEPSASEFNQH